MNIKNHLLALDGSAHSQFVLLQKVAKRLSNLSRGRSEQRAILNTLGRGKAFNSAAWQLTWSIPEVSTNCQGAASLCVSVSNASTLDNYLLSVNSLYGETLKLTAKLKKKSSLGAKLAKAYEKAAKNALTSSVNASKAVPRDATKCS